MNPRLLFAAGIIPFIVLATLNSAGARYGASDQAFYVPAILDEIDPALFPRDSELIHSQSDLTLVDETVAGVAQAPGVTLQIVVAGLYVAALGLLAWGALSFGRELYATSGASLALLFGLTLRHAIMKTGTNTLEGYFHPRQLAFALGALSLAAYLRQGCAWPVLVLLTVAAVVHPTTALWFIVWIGVAMFVSERRLRIPLAGLTAAGAAVAVWALAAGPLEGRLVRMDDAWLATLETKDYLFPLEWPAAAWLVNVGYVPLILWVYRLRRAAGVVRDRESAMLAGALSLAVVFVIGLALQAGRIALAIQLQPARVFWMLDFLATAYVIWLVAEGRVRGQAVNRERGNPGSGREHDRAFTIHGLTSNRAAVAAVVVLCLAAARGGYVAYVRFPERSFAELDVPDNDWGRAMAWARRSDKASHWIADPEHAARYGTSVRVAGHRDVFVEEIKDTAIGMYDRDVAMRTHERLQQLGEFAELTPERARLLSAKYDLHFLVTENALNLPLAFRSGAIRVYKLR